MVQVYVNLIKKGLWQLDNVPGIWREDVRQQLLDEGYSKG